MPFLWRVCSMSILADDLFYFQSVSRRKLFRLLSHVLFHVPATTTIKLQPATVGYGRPASDVLRFTIFYIMIGLSLV